MFSFSTTKDDRHQFIAIEKVKKGDFLKVNKDANGKGVEVYRTEGFCRYNKKYCLQAESDMNKQRYIKKGTIVEIGFEY